MKFFHSIFFVLYIKVSICDRLYSGYIEDTQRPIHPNDVRFKPTQVDRRHPNFHAAQKKATRKPFTDVPLTTDSSCVRNARRKQEEEEAENPTKEYRPSGNRWHGAVYYGRDQFPSKKLITIRNPKIKDITPVQRKLHKCYKWISSDHIKRYEWPAVIQTSATDNTVLIEICCPHFGPVRIMGNTLCQPYCQSCHNGKCVAPEVCECHDGYVSTDNKDCVFTCPISCLNGRCNLLTRGCLCNSGYSLDETGQFCRPVCQAGCGMNPLHNCTAPDVCGCVRGYSLTDNDCQPIGRGAWAGRRY